MENSDSNSKFKKRDSIVIASLVIGGLFLIISFLAPYVFTSTLLGERTNFDESSAQTGDTFGIMNPFIALVGISLTFLAFYMQYKANQLQRDISDKAMEENQKQFQKQLEEQEKQYKIQQFESQFFEMLKLHKENVNEMKVYGTLWEGSNFKNISYKGRDIFSQLKNEIESLIRITGRYNPQMKMGWELPEIEIITDQEEYLVVDKNNFKELYKIFFWGFNHYFDKYQLPKYVIGKIKNIQTLQQFPPNNYNGDIKLNIDAFQGHSSILGHYYRHLYLMVKFVDKNETVNEYSDKMKYLKILRAQLTNDEQIMLFYNWLGGYGEDWEKGNRRFFTKYKMIHNVWLDLLYKDSFIDERINFLEERFRETNLDGALFEENE